MAIHTHYVIQAYMLRNDDGSLIDSATVDIFDPLSEGEALERAEKRIKKDFYRVTQIIEHDFEVCKK